MQNNFYTKPKFNTPNTISKRKDSVLFVDYLAHFISNSATKRVQGYGTVGLAKNTIRTYNSLHRVVKAFEFAKSEILFLHTIVDFPKNVDLPKNVDFPKNRTGN